MLVGLRSFLCIGLRGLNSEVKFPATPIIVISHLTNVFYQSSHLHSFRSIYSVDGFIICILLYGDAIIPPNSSTSRDRLQHCKASALLISLRYLYLKVKTIMTRLTEKS